ncbi:MAG: hypothetical protein ACI8UD_000403 [Planctomycetota bacterium]|jgi:hypothetical protein
MATILLPGKGQPSSCQSDAIGQVRAIAARASTAKTDRLTGLTPSGAGQVESPAQAASDSNTSRIRSC